MQRKNRAKYTTLFLFLGFAMTVSFQNCSPAKFAAVEQSSESPTSSATPEVTEDNLTADVPRAPIVPAPIKPPDVIPGKEAGKKETPEVIPDKVAGKKDTPEVLPDSLPPTDSTSSGSECPEPALSAKVMSYFDRENYKQKNSDVKSCVESGRCVAWAENGFMTSHSLVDGNVTDGSWSHYLRGGYSEGRSAVRFFDSMQYMAENPDVLTDK